MNTRPAAQPDDVTARLRGALEEAIRTRTCADAGVVVTGYSDDADGTMEETGDGGGHFVEVALRPRVTVSDESMIGPALRLHEEASARCFIARSVNFPVRHEPVVTAEVSRTVPDSARHRVRRSDP